VVKVSIEVRNGAACYVVAVRAESIRRALEIVGARYPKGDVRVKFPIDPEGFFVKDPAARAEIVGFEQPKRIAA
jgi:metal-sulfur cluster biosynthetic enzyme